MPAYNIDQIYPFAPRPIPSLSTHYLPPISTMCSLIFKLTKSTRWV